VGPLAPGAARGALARLSGARVAVFIVTHYDKCMVRKASKEGPGRPSTGLAMTAAERMRRLRKRRKAAGLKAVVTWVTEEPGRFTYSSHRLLEARSLAMHAVIARKIERDRSLLEVPKKNLERWRARWKEEAPRWLAEWEKLLQQSWPRIAALITEPSERAARLRQSSPFAGVLSAEERRRIYETFRA
jgi:hypothetical protein